MRVARPTIACQGAWRTSRNFIDVVILKREHAMKRRKQGGPATTHALKGRHLGAKRSTPGEIVPVLTAQAGQDEIRGRAVAAGVRRRNGKPKSKQPPLSEEMKTVTEIGSGRWKSGQTK